MSRQRLSLADMRPSPFPCLSSLPFLFAFPLCLSSLRALCANPPFAAHSSLVYPEEQRGTRHFLIRTSTLPSARFSSPSAPAHNTPPTPQSAASSLQQRTSPGPSA